MSVTVCRVTVVKSFTYRTEAEEFSNQYAFKGAPPSEGDDASWLVLFNDVIAKERPVFTSRTTFVRAYGYNSSDPKAHHVAQHDFTVPGPPPAGTRQPLGNPMAGDQAACVEWLMDRLSAKGKPVYLRKYFHDGELNPSNPDGISPELSTILTTFAGTTGIQAVHGGLRTGLDNIKAGTEAPNDSVKAAYVIGWSTTRTLKRRGKRPRIGS